MVAETRGSKARGSGTGGGLPPPSPPRITKPEAAADVKHPSPLKRQRTPSAKYGPEEYITSPHNFAKGSPSASPSKRAKSGMQHAKPVGGQQSMEGSGLQEASAEGGPGQLQGSSGVPSGSAAMAAAEGAGADGDAPWQQIPGVPLVGNEGIRLSGDEAPTLGVAEGGTAEPAPAEMYQWMVIAPSAAAADPAVAARTLGTRAAATAGSLATRAGTPGAKGVSATADANGGNAAVGAVQTRDNALRPTSADSFQRFLCHLLLPDSSDGLQLQGQFEEVESAGLLVNPFACGAQLEPQLMQHLAPDLDAVIDELAASDLEEDDECYPNGDLEAAGPEVEAVAPGWPVAPRPGSAAAAATLMRGHTVPQGFLVDLLEDGAAALGLAPPDTQDDEEEKLDDSMLVNM